MDLGGRRCCILICPHFPVSPVPTPALGLWKACCFCSWRKVQEGPQLPYPAYLPALLAQMGLLSLQHPGRP